MNLDNNCNSILRILHVDLSTKKIWNEMMEPEVISLYLGGRGANALILYQSLPPLTDPLSNSNILVFGCGYLNGTIAPCSGRVTVTTKSPATGRYLKTNAGGAWGAMLKNAGWDHIVLHGTAPQPVFLYIKNDKVQIRDANYLWGKDIRETTQLLKNTLGKETEVACIGPAGENRVAYAGIAFSYFSMAARGGAGAVMGSKNLKAIAVYGNKGIKAANEKAFWDECLSARKALEDDPGTPSYYLYGTAGSVSLVNSIKAFPSYNFRQGFFPDAELISGERLVSDGYLKARRGCFSCLLNCHRYVRIDNGPYKGTVAGPEYETLGSFGAGCGISDLEAVIRADELCNMLGLDTISTGSAVQWAMECFERGVLSLKDTDGLELNFGNVEAMLTLIEWIGLRKGLGNILAKGLRSAAEEISQDSYKWAVQANGLEQSRVETRSANAYALAFAVNPRGPDHLHSEPLAEFGLDQASREIIKMITGDEKFATPYTCEKRAQIVRWHEDVYAAGDSLGFCAFTNTALYDITPERMAAMFSAFTGLNLKADELLEAGRRILNLERCFNVREGFDRKNDVLPWRLMHERQVDRDDPEAINSPEKLSKMLDEYYELHGWNIESGVPTRSTLQALNLDFLIPDLEKTGKL